jgi:hypothetical protein
VAVRFGVSRSNLGGPGTLEGMARQKEDEKKRGVTARDVWRLVLTVIAIIAIVQELKKPKDERTWHGKVAALVPYDFRKPTVDRFKETYWNPEGPIVSGKAWGVGWAPNFGAVKRLIGA